jgi:hypothetical protein
MIPPFVKGKGRAYICVFDGKGLPRGQRGRNHNLLATNTDKKPGVSFVEGAYTQQGRANSRRLLHTTLKTFFSVASSTSLSPHTRALMSRAAHSARLNNEQHGVDATQPLDLDAPRPWLRTPAPEYRLLCRG